MKTIIFEPSRCTAKLPEDLDKPFFIAEEKMDGSRYVLYIGCDPYERRTGNTLLSRRVSVVDGKHVDRTLNVPHITLKLYPGLEGTVLDGEIMSDDFLATNSIMNSAPALAVQKQEESTPLRYHVFDVMCFRGKDVRHLPLSERRKIVEAVCQRMGNGYVSPIRQVTENLSEFFKEIVERGGEGIIVKDTRSAYGVGWAKMKKSYDVSCIVTGWKPGNGKYAGIIGALALSVIHDGRVVEVGFASGFDDALRHDMSKYFEKYNGRVVDVFTQEIQDSKRSIHNPVGRLRHPTFHRFRDDLNAADCTSVKLWNDLKAQKTRSSRYKGEER